MPLVFEPKECNPELRDLGIHVDERDYKLYYPELSKEIISETNSQNDKAVMDIFKKFAKEDLFFLGYFVLDLPINDPFLMARCYDIQNLNHFSLDLWSREHWKSTIITFLYSIFTLIQNPEERIGIFSLNRTLAKSHMRKIKTELETNTLLKRIFPDIFFMNPSQALKWSEDDGLYVKRKKTYGEASVEAWGLIDGMPTGKHFTTMIFDDIITETSISTPGQVEKADRQFKLAQNLGARGGRKRVVGTRYGSRDVYGSLIKAKRWKERIFPAEVDEFGNAKRHGTPVLLTVEELNEKYDDQGEYIYCLTGENRILTSDFLNKKIIDIGIGDEIIGMQKGELHSKTAMVKTTVTNKWEYELPCVELVLENGKKIRCTKEHQWWTGRHATEKDPGRQSYYPAGFGKCEVSELSQLFDFNLIDREISTDEEKAFFYLAGMFDADGSVSGKALHICQSNETNRPICEKIEWALNKLNIEFSVKEKKHDDKQNINDYYIKGGRSVAWELLNRTGLGKGFRIIDNFLNKANRINSRGGVGKVKILEINDIGIQKVYAIETGTNNYVAEGFISKNSCQMLQNPVAVSKQKLNEKWIVYTSNPKKPYMNYYLVIDPASSKKKDSDYTVMQVWGADPYKKLWMVDMIRDRMGLGEKWDAIRMLTAKWEIQDVGYEKYGMQADVEYFQEKMDESHYFLNVIELGGQVSKIDRIKKLVPYLQKGRIVMPRSLLYTTLEGKTLDLMVDYIEDEYKLFPLSKHDDMLDCSARILDSKMNVIFPVHKKEQYQVKNIDDPLELRSSDNEVRSWMEA